MKRKALRGRSEGSIPPYVTEAEFRKQRRDSLLCSSLLVALLLWLPAQSLAQELNARVTVNVDRLGSSADQAIVSDLTQQLTEMINQTRWTNATFSPMERIECAWGLNLVSVSDDGLYTAELSISAQRPVYGASYTTPLLVHLDRELNFQYAPYQPLVYAPTQIDNNLVATVAFYAYLILALDFDSFAPLGGDYAARQMQQLVATAQQMMDWSGWKAYASDNNRYAISQAYNDPAHQPWRNYWYQYHRQGLDLLTSNLRRGYTNILEQLSLLEETWQANSMSPLLQIFAQTKLDELPLLVEGAPQDSRMAAYKTLSKIFPTEDSKLSALKK